jgi:hypothetical protein
MEPLLPQTQSAPTWAAPTLGQLVLDHNDVPTAVLGLPAAILPAA